MIEDTTQLTKFPERKVLRITNRSHCLLFCLKRVSKVKRTAITTIITNIFLEYNSRMEIGEDSRVEHPTSYYQRILTNYFVGFYPYPTPKYKIKGAMNPRRFHLVTDKIFIQNIKQLALPRAMSVNEFVLQVLYERMIEELNNDPMLYEKNIPNYQPIIANRLY